MRTLIRAIATAAAISLFSIAAAGARADDANAAVRTALAELEKWVGNTPSAKGWSDYLKLPALRAELDKGDQASQTVLAEELWILDSGAPGLELAPFVKLRQAVAQWSGELTLAKTPGLSEAILGQESSFHAFADADVTRAKSGLTTAVGNLDRFLKASGANGDAWKKYLHWQDLEAQIKSDAPDVEALRTVLQQFSADQNGLEMPVFSQVAAALERYVNILSARKDDLAAQYAAQLKGLADELKQYTDQRTDELALAVGGRLGWLDNMRQALGLVRVLRSRYSQPNLHVAMSSRLVAAGINGPVDESAPVVDVILGTDISGTGHTVGSIEAHLVPNPNQAEIETRLAGTVATRTVGYNGPATIFSNGTTKIQGRKHIVIDAGGIAGLPATATASTKTNIAGVSARSGIVERIATKKVYQSKTQAEQIGSRHAADRVRRRVDAQAMTQLSKANADYVQKLRNPLLRRREFPELLKFSTTAESLFLTALQADRNQIAAPDKPPAVSVANDLAVQLHESAVNNLAAALLSGLTLKEEDLQARVIELRGSLPDQLKSDEDRDPWSITFAKSRPVTVKFADNGFQITVRGQRFTSGDRDFRAMNVTADYKVEQSGHGSKLVRQGDLQIFPPGFVPGQNRLSPQQVSLKTLLQKRFGKLFEAEINNDGLVLPGRWREAGRLDLKQLQAGGGWLVMAWIESGVPAPPEEKVARVEP